MIEIRVDPYPGTREFSELWRAAWAAEWQGDLTAILQRSLGHLGAYDGERLVGYVNVASDGGAHAFILDTSVDPHYRRTGLGTKLVKAATALARERGAEWLHVDYEPHLEGFYRACGFRPTAAGLIRLEPAGGS